MVPQRPGGQKREPHGKLVDVRAATPYAWTMAFALSDRREQQTAAAVLIIRPAHFAGNAETRQSNHFQRLAAAADDDVAEHARREFDTFATRLALAGVEVSVFAGRRDERLPDEIFPNNWLSLHADGTAVLYPMLAANRRLERRAELLDALRTRGYRIDRVVDLSWLEQHDRFLEGTGSLVLDRTNRIAYACLSPRTHPDALAEFARELRYDVLPFLAVDREGRAIYHTNVLMSVGSKFAVICSQAIGDVGQREHVLHTLGETGHEIVDLDFAQLHAFAGNVLELRGRWGPVIALSTAALESLTPSRQEALGRHGRLVSADLERIELLGGGSARCMLAEVACPHSRV